MALGNSWDLSTFIRLTSQKKQQGKLLRAVITFEAYDGAAAGERLPVCCSACVIVWKLVALLVVSQPA